MAICGFFPLMLGMLQEKKKKGRTDLTKRKVRVIEGISGRLMLTEQQDYQKSQGQWLQISLHIYLAFKIKSPWKSQHI